MNRNVIDRHKPLLPFKCDRCKEMVTEEKDLFRHRAAPGGTSVCMLVRALKRSQNIVDTEGELVTVTNLLEKKDD